MAEPEVSGTPDNAPIWDENNELVHEELKANALEFSEAVMQPVAYASEFYQDYDSAKEYQAQEGQTTDVTTNPQPTGDPNTMPTAFTIPEPQEAIEPQAGVQSGGGGSPSPTAPTATPVSAPSAPAPVSGTSGTGTGTAGTPVAGGTGATGGSSSGSGS
jgi:hypothetical protein